MRNHEEVEMKIFPDRKLKNIADHQQTPYFLKLGHKLGQESISPALWVKQTDRSLQT